MEVKIGSFEGFFSFIFSEKEYFSFQEILEVVQKELPNTKIEDIRIYNDQQYGRVIVAVNTNQKQSETTT